MREMVKPFYFLRHGETDYNVKRLFTGQTDVVLNQKGIDQAHHIGKNLIDKNISLIVSSPLQRACQTAEIISNYIHKSIEIIPGLQECSFGELEGTPIGDGTDLQNWAKGMGPKKAENIADFDFRIKKTFEKLFACKKENFLVVSHGGVHSSFFRIYKMPNLETQNTILYQHTPILTPFLSWTCDAI